jgi:ABC-type transport system involved in multi-copper enzyme maturation permease subunit
LVIWISFDIRHSSFVISQMTFLPIVERELRVASRRRATYWMRFFLALGVFALWLLVLLMAPAALPVSRGEMVFMCISTLALAFCLLAGVFLTADSISEEKREGSLGLLFLTELKGYDVVLGKLMGTSLHAFYALLAIFPLLAYSLLLGGVTPGEFWRVTLALTATLMLSLSIGMLVSGMSRDTRQAMGATLLALALLAGVLPALVGLWALIFKKAPIILMWPSPACVYSFAFDSLFHSPGGKQQYVGSLLAVLLLSAGALAAAGRHVAGAWREKTQDAKERESPARSSRFRFGGAAFRAGRVGLMEANPFQWLVSRDRMPGLIAWRTLGFQFLNWLGFVFGCLGTRGTTRELCFNAAILIAYSLHHVLKWFIAIESSRRLSDDRHSGALELLLVTPVSIEQIISGQKRALRRMFRGPMVLALLTNIVMLWMLISINPAGLGKQEAFIYFEVGIGGAVMLPIDFYALSWVGMWTALLTKRHNRAILSTLGRVMLAPWLAIVFLVLMTIGGRTLTLDAALALAPVWFILAAVVEHTFAARAKIGLVEALRQISSGADLRAVEPAIPDQAPALNLAER